ncbi:cytochrome c-type biogenesis protein [Neogemmobacter tilapiae]|uniref:Cytochrome c-type biogenesis protein n=1 Tax=Neogemmobacter tilapiae TaxID=875041 RepID=A0A918WFY8_9RHOB|nr:cytochrome c-type biogenesis protein [Gemmobacter tilapiae]GHC43866.1 cytochrome c biogenesis protein CcdA [Gemmobacter tilapiae]
MIRALLLLLALATPVWAVELDEMLADPAQEARARDLSKGLRCLVCRNENIDDSHATIARDLRLFLRERIAAGDTDEQAIAAIVARYGEYVLLNPTTGGANILLWLAGPLLLLLGGGIAVATLRRRAVAAEVTGLSEEEQARLRELTGD